MVNTGCELLHLLNDRREQIDAINEYYAMRLAGKFAKILYYPDKEGKIPPRYKDVFHFYNDIKGKLPDLNVKEFRLAISQPFAITVGYETDIVQGQLVEVYDMAAIKALCFDELLKKLPSFEKYREMYVSYNNFYRLGEASKDDLQEALFHLRRYE